MNACRAIAVILACTAPAFAQDSTGPVAVVNGEPISRAEFQALLARRTRTGIRVVATEQKQMERDVVAALVDSLLLKQFLRASAPEIDKADIDRQFAALEKALAAQKRTIDDYCRENHQTPDQLRANVAAGLQWKEYATARLTEAGLKQHFAENKAQFDRAWVRASQIVFRVSPTASAAERSAERQKLAALRREIVDGKLPFAEAAAKHSQCTTASIGGDLGYVSRRGMVEEPVAKAAFALPVGGVSDVIETENSLKLVLVTDKKPGSFAFYEDPRIRAEVFESAMEEMRQRLRVELRAKAKVEIKLP